MMRLCLRCALLVALFVGAEAMGQLTAESSNLSMVSGYGRLTVGVDRSGGLSACRWPSPGYFDQLSYHESGSGDSSVDVGHGALWGILLDDEWLWMNDSRWEIEQHYDAVGSAVMVTVSRWPESSLVVRQQMRVKRGADVFVSEIVVEGTEVRPRLFWYADFSPSTRHLPELGASEAYLDRLNDFAVFSDVDAGRVVHFRPKAPGMAEWDLAERLASRGAEAAAWESFSAGAWIGIHAESGVDSVYTGTGNLRLVKVAEDAFGGGLDRSAASGRCWSLTEVIAQHDEDGSEARVVVGFAPDFENLKSLLAEHGADAEEEALRDFSAPGLNTISDPDVRDAMTRAARSLLTFTDARTGAMVQGIATEPAVARDWPREGVLSILALDVVGAHRVAQRHLNFYRGLIRREQHMGKPVGSLPVSAYTNGVESSPHLLVDEEGAAWLLWAIWRHAAFLKPDARGVFLESAWDDVQLCADFLVRWTDARRGAPLWAEDPITLRDTRTKERLYSARLGVDSALKIAGYIEREPPRAWVRRMAKVDTLVRSLLVDEKLWSQAGEPLPIFLGEFVDIDRPIVAAALDARLRELPNLTGSQAARVVLEAVLIVQRNPERLNSLQPFVSKALMDNISLPDGAESAVGELRVFPDAYALSQSLIAAHLAFR